MSAALIESVRDGTWRDLMDLPASHRVALEFAEAMTATPPAVDDALFARLQEHFDARGIVELTALCAWENYRARFNCALGVEAHGFHPPPER